jgi:hypothetical protein
MNNFWVTIIASRDRNGWIRSLLGRQIILLSGNYIVNVVVIIWVRPIGFYLLVTKKCFAARCASAAEVLPVHFRHEEIVEVRVDRWVC